MAIKKLSFDIFIAFITYLSCFVKGNNLALHKPTSQSSNYGQYPFKFNSSNAVDGNDRCAFDNDVVSHTLATTITWWQVDLQDFYYVTHVKITNRYYAWERLSNFTVEISEAEPSTLTGFPGNTKEAWICVRVMTPIPTLQTSQYDCPNIHHRGRYVRLVKYNTINPKESYLSLCEFEAYGLRKYTLESMERVSSVVAMVTFVSGQMTLLECVRECVSLHKTSACQFIHYNTQTAVCQLLDKNGGDEGDGEGWIFFKVIV